MIIYANKGCDDRVDEGEIVGNSFGRAPLGIRKRRQGGRTGNRGKEHGESSVGKERDGSDDMVDIAWGELQVWMRREGGRKGNGGK